MPVDPGLVPRGPVLLGPTGVGDEDQVLASDGLGGTFWVTMGAPDLSGYALLAGRAGGQSLTGGTAAGETLLLSSTSHATKGSINLGSVAYVDQANAQLIVKAKPGQAVNQTEWRNSADTVILRVSAAGQIIADRSLSSGVRLDATLLNLKSTNATCIIADANAGHGVQGSTMSPNHAGVYGIGAGIGVGVGASTGSGLGVRGECTNGYGTAGTTTNIGVGVLAQATLGTGKPLVVMGVAGHSANLVTLQHGGVVIAAITGQGAFQPPRLPDVDAPNGSLYYSTTQAKLVFKDSAGAVNVLY